MNYLVSKPTAVGDGALARLLKAAWSGFDYLDYPARAHHRRPTTRTRAMVPDCPVCHSQDLSRSIPITVCNDCEWTSGSG